MSDLIERLEEDLKWMTGYDYPDQKEVSSRLTRSDLIEAISALKTVRVIEGMANRGRDVEIIITKLDEFWIEVYSINSGVKDLFSGTTLAAAVEAAGKKGDG